MGLAVAEAHSDHQAHDDQRPVAPHDDSIKAWSMVDTSALQSTRANHIPCVECPGVGATAVYGRISKDKTGRLEKVETQLEAGRRYAEQHWPGQEIRTYSDNDLSAADPDVYRPDYDRLLHDIRAGHISQIVCAEQSRLTRQPSEWEELAVTLSKAGIERVHGYRGGITEVAGSKLVGRILAAVDAEEVERLRARINDRLGALAADGRPHGGTPFAYRRAEVDGRKHIEADPDRAPIVTETAERILSGWSLTAVAEDLNRRGVPTARGGKKWTASSVRSMVTNPTVAGWRTHRGRLTPATWQPILERDIWYHVRHILDTPYTVEHPNGQYRGSRTRGAPRRRYLLSGGIALCGICLHPLAGQQRQNRRKERVPVYSCHPSTGGKGCVSILAEPLEQHVVAEMVDEMERRFYHQDLGADDSDDRRARLAAELAALEVRRVEMSAMYAVGDLTPAEWTAARGALASKMTALSAELAGLPVRVEQADPVLVRRGWDGMTLDERRQLVVIHVASVTVTSARPGTRGFDKSRVAIGWRTVS